MIIKFQFLTLWLLWLVTSLAQGAETDFMAGRNSLPDSSSQLDKIMNRALEKAASRAKSCADEQLHLQIIKGLGGFGRSEIEKWGDRVPSKGVNFGSSIYAELGDEASYLDWSCCAKSMRIGDAIVSSDKLGHFLHSGYEMYLFARLKTGKPLPDQRSVVAKMYDWLFPHHINESKCSIRQADKAYGPGPPCRRHYLESKKTFQDQLARQVAGLTEISMAADIKVKTKEDAVFQLSHAQEEGGWGLSGTGVRSYGDIAANYEGFRFWSEMIEGDNPYFKCIDGKWKKIREFKWKTYASAAWDEGINCSDYATEKMTRVVKARVSSAASAQKQKALSCPLDPQKCRTLVKTLWIFKSKVNTSIL